MLATGGGFSDSFNDNTIFRYNIIERDGLEARENGEKFVFKVSGKITNTKYHNNVIYLSAEQQGVDLMFHKQWSGKPANTEYYNNIYYLEGTNHKYNLSNSTGTKFSNNIFYATSSATLPTDAEALTSDPLFEVVGQGPTGYKLKANSPAIASGKEITNNAVMDYFGNALPANGVIDRGAQQYSAPKNANTPGGYSKENFDIYLLIGQSNMAGRGDIESIDEVPLEKAYLFNDTKNWENASVPLNKYSTTRKDLSYQKMNPVYTFARKLTEYTDKGIGLVVNARGGTSIEQWQKGYNGNDDFDLYEQAIARLLAAKKDGTFKGIIWHQGESNQSSSSTYMAKLKKLVSDLRTDLGENVFFVAGELGKWHEETIPMNTVIDGIANDINQSSYIKSDGLKPINDDLTNPHFNGYSQRILGCLYADEVLKNIYNMSPGVVSIYSKSDFKGYKSVLNPGIYTLEELQKRGIYDNDIRSLEIEAGYEALLFTGQKEGQSELISATKNSLVGTAVNEDVSYLIIGKTGTTEDINLSVDKKPKKVGSILVSPNPVKKNISISFPSDLEVSTISKIQIVDIAGRSFNVKTPTNSQTNSQLDIDLHQFNLSSGLYFLVLETNNQVFKKKMIIE